MLYIMFSWSVVNINIFQMFVIFLSFTSIHLHRYIFLGLLFHNLTTITGNFPRACTGLFRQRSNSLYLHVLAMFLQPVIVCFYSLHKHVLAMFLFPYVSVVVNIYLFIVLLLGSDQ